MKNNKSKPRKLNINIKSSYEIKNATESPEELTNKISEAMRLAVEDAQKSIRKKYKRATFEPILQEFKVRDGNQTGSKNVESEVKICVRF